MFTIGETQTTSHANVTEHRKHQQPAVNPRGRRFVTETPPPSGAKTRT